jgi:homogentisate 1,2-dioxygenase
MEIPYVKGKTTLQAHVDIPPGLVEEEFGRGGFFGRYAHLYRSDAPVGWSRIEGPLRPKSFDLSQMEAEAGDYLRDRKPTLFNNDVRVSFSILKKPMNYYFRNADGDEVLFVHRGQGELQTDFGPLEYNVGDYLVIPRGTVYRLVPGTESKFLVIESFSEIRLPEKGMIGQHSLFDPAMMRVPEPKEMKAPQGPEFELKIQRCGEITSVFYPFCPLNTIGWKGTLTVWQLNVADIRPISSDRYHLPPSAHTTFVAQNFVICSFLPRPLENGDPGCVKVPFYHSNIDYDEVLFYHDGEFFSRTDIRSGMITFHPQGIHHGPQKGAIARSKDAKYTNEVAVMIDTRNPLQVAKELETFENKNYWQSWKD